MKFGQPWVKAWARSLAFLIPLLVMTSGASSDEPIGPTVGNLPTAVPVVPKLRPRKLGEFSTPDREPVSNFVESVSGGDAVIEVYVGQSRILSTKAQIANQNGIGVIASGDPTVIDFDVLPNPRLIRILGKRVGRIVTVRPPPLQPRRNTSFGCP